MRRNAELIALIVAFILLSASLAALLTYHSLAGQLGISAGHALPGLVLVQGLSAIIVLGLTFFVFRHQRYSWLSVRSLAFLQSAMVTMSVAALFVAVFSATAALTSSEPKGEAATPSSRKAHETVAWTQFGLGNSPDVIARALIDTTAECPTIDDGSGIHRMHERRDPRSSVFGRLCEKRITWRSKDLEIEIKQGGERLLKQTVRQAPKTMAVIGDTGCRIARYVDQGCLSDRTWPFGLIVNSAARAAPHLVLHVGDYLYREAACDGSSIDCGGKPFGDREESWRIDFFDPARELLATAPWIFVRGNHEDCQRGGYGWFYYFGDSTKACEVTHEPAYLRFADVLVLHFDTSHADDEYAYKKVNKKWDDIAREIAQTPVLSVGEAGSSPPVLLLTHKPAYALCNEDNAPASGTVVAGPSASGPAGSRCDGKRKDKVSVANMGGPRRIIDAMQVAKRRVLVLSGDIHTFQVLDVVPDASSADEAVTQVIVGNGGSSLDNYSVTGPPPSPVNFTFQDYRLKYDSPTEEWIHPPFGNPLNATAQVWPVFGFGLLVLGGSPRIELVALDPHGNRQFSCDLGVGRKPPFTQATSRCR